MKVASTESTNMLTESNAVQSGNGRFQSDLSFVMALHVLVKSARKMSQNWPQKFIFSLVTDRPPSDAGGS